MDNNKLIHGIASAGRADVILGLQYGDEGKGHIVDAIAENYDYIVRFQGGANSGHTIKKNDGSSIITRILPSGIFSGKVLVLGRGMVIDMNVLRNEIVESSALGGTFRLLIDKNAHLTLPLHLHMDEAWDQSKTIGSTKKGNSPTYVTKYSRSGVVMGDVVGKPRSAIVDVIKNSYELISRHHGINYQFGEDDISYIDSIVAILSLKFVSVCDCPMYLNDKIRGGASILLEGAQGYALSISGESYPDVTSSDISTASAFVGSGISPKYLGKVMGIIKGYSTRVGTGIFNGEITDKPIADSIRKEGKEFGSVTGRPRRIGWLDIDLVNRSIIENGVNEIIVTKLDVLYHLDSVSVFLDGKIQNIGKVDEDNLDLMLSMIDIEFGIRNARISVISTGDKPDDIRPYGINKYLTEHKQDGVEITTSVSIGNADNISIPDNHNLNKKSVSTYLNVYNSDDPISVKIIPSGWSDKYHMIVEYGEYNDYSNQLVDTDYIKEKFNIDISEYYAAK